MTKKEPKKAVSKAQRNLFGWAYACAKDDSKKDCPENITKLGKKFKEKYPEDLKSMAKTKHKGLPKKIKNEKMKWIKSRKIFERAEKEQLYDGTWGDTYIGQLFGWIGRRIISKIASKRIEKLVDKLNNVVNNKPLEEFVATDSDVVNSTPYIKIIELKDYVYTDGFNLEIFKDLLEDSIKYHEEIITREYIKEKPAILAQHQDILAKMKSIRNEFESITESLILENKESDPIEMVNDILIHFKDKPLMSGKTDTLSTVDIGTQGRYEEHIENIRAVIEDMQNMLKKSNYKKSKYISSEKKKELSDFIEYLYPPIKGGKMNWDNPGAIRAALRKVNEKITDFLNTFGEKLKSVDKKEKVVDIKKSIENKIGPIVEIKWVNKKGDLVKGWSTEKWLEVLDENANIDVEKVLNNQEAFKIYHKGKKDEQYAGFAPTESMIKNIKKIADIEIKKDENIKYQHKAKKLLDEKFPNDSTYIEAIQKANNKKEEIKSKIDSDIIKEVDPIEVLKIFNQAFNMYTIPKEEYDGFSERFSSKVASRKRRNYKVENDVAINRKLFKKWNDSVLDWLKLNPNLDKNIKKFVIEMMDNHQMFNRGSGQTGMQAKLLASIFGVQLNKPFTYKNKSRYGSGMDIGKSSSKIYAEFSKDVNGEFKISEKGEIQLLKKNFERVPFAIRDNNDNIFFFLLLNMDEKVICKMSMNYISWLQKYDSIQIGDIEVKNEEREVVYISLFDIPEGTNRSISVGDTLNINYVNITQINEPDIEPISGVINVNQIYILSGKDDKKMFQIKPPVPQRIESPDKYIESVGALTNRLKDLRLI